ncbi:phosphatase 2C-like domain-containing protein [Scenedesmus sp. NREL 46B-D3]|nr:phosphatase 2C-like domain-containing protein [Scenedesmus sp. NREL 46B-D3]
MAASMQQSARVSTTRTSHRSNRVVVRAASVAVSAPVVVKQKGAYTCRGTVRKVNEDRYDVKVVAPTASDKGDPFAFAGVYDGHGGSAVAEWLSQNLFSVVGERWQGGNAAESCINDAYIQADKQLLVSKGFMGLGERGIGGSKCGATAVNALMFTGADGSSQLLTANVGDARILLIRNGEAVELTEEHVPDKESERVRIERNNPNPKLPMVRYIGGTWRVGGLLALSRAFGDAYLKGSLQFEGITAGGDGYSSGFGLVATPYTTLTRLTPQDSYLVLASDGLFAEEARGGGGGLDNDGVAELCRAAGANADCSKLAETLARTAVKVGSTDDVTVVVMRLGA